MNALRTLLMPALTVPAATMLLSLSAASGQPAQNRGPTLTRPASPSRVPATNGFLQRWLVLEPIRGPIGSNAELADSFVQAGAQSEEQDRERGLVQGTI